MELLSIRYLLKLINDFELTESIWKSDGNKSPKMVTLKVPVS